MTTEGEQPESRILVLRDTDDDDGTMWRAVVVYAEGYLSIQGLDTGPGVQRAFGTDEYEFARELTVAETTELRRLLGIGDRDDLLAALGERFTSTAEIEQFLVDKKIPGTLTTGMR